MDSKKDNDIELIEFETIVETLSALIEKGTDAVLSFFKSDAWNTALDIGSDLGKVIRIISGIRKLTSIPDKIWMKRFELYCQGLLSIPVQKREKYVKKVGKHGLNKDSVFILGVLSRNEELSKIDIFVTLFAARINEIIDEETYRRMMLLVDRTMYSDVLYLIENCSDGNISIDNDAKQGLLANGWLIYSGQPIVGFNEDSYFIYRYTDVSKRFCRIVKPMNLIAGT